jgi:elongation factor P hydroxylase
MKLYTEEQVIDIFQKYGNMSEINARNIIDLSESIELPNDEEIREERLLQFPDSEYANRANDRLAFYCGAKFVINKIQGGNK